MSQVDTPSEYEHTAEDLRKEIVHTAFHQLEFASTGAGIHAKQAGPPEDGRATRIGWERLAEYFNLAYDGSGAGKYHETDIKFLSGQLQHWCGIFSLYCIKTAGVSIGNWKNSQGISSLLKLTQDPQPGDVGYFAKDAHHCVIVSVDGDTITSIDGNSGLDSTINKRVRQRSEFSGFYAVPV